VYVDNLVYAIQLAAESRTGVGEAFFIGDAEEVSWLEFYQTLARILGVDEKAIHHVARPFFPPTRVTLRERFDSILNESRFQNAIRILPRRLKHPLRAAITSFLAGGRPTEDLSPWDETPSSAPAISHELCLLQECEGKVSHAKATRILGYEPIVTLAEGWRRTAGWLTYSGFTTHGEFSLTC
jgi:nucleoside-diphosphate-sugar epimerase